MTKTGEDGDFSMQSRQTLHAVKRATDALSRDGSGAGSRPMLSRNFTKFQLPAYPQQPGPQTEVKTSAKMKTTINHHFVTIFC
ncbi:MAG TPA: hypothetical protein VJ969_09020 [Desulfopila sp.]|nr:hypothetical protein [Desulfopila sp.]